MRISIDDINRRQQMKTTRFNRSSIMSEASVYMNNGTFNTTNAINNITNWQSLSEDTNIAFDKALDSFVELCLNCSNPSVIRTQASFLVENVDKVRDASALMNSIKYRNSRLKSKIGTKITKKITGVNAAINNAIGNINQTLHKAGIAGGGNPGVASKTESTIEEAFTKLYDAAKRVKECDRVVENYNKISKSFDIDGIAVFNESDIYQTAIDIASCVDKYNTSFKAKYNSAIETCVYVLNKHYIANAPSKVIEGVTDYFIFNHGLSEHNIQDIRDLAKSSVLVEEYDFDDCDYLWQIPLANDQTSVDYVDPEYFTGDFGVVAENELSKALLKKSNDIKHGIRGIKKDARAINKMVKKNVKHGNPEEHKDEEIKQMINNFRKQASKDSEKSSSVINFKGLVNKLFTRDADLIIEELPSVFGIMRGFFVATTFGINPILGIVTLITDQCIKMTLDRKQMEKIINAYTKELESVNKRIEKTKNDEEKEKLEKYKEILKKDLEKLREYDRSNYTDEENDERGAWNYDDGDGDDFGMDFNFDDDDDWDTDFDEAAIKAMAGIIVAEQFMTHISEQLVDDEIDGVVCDKIFKMPNTDIPVFADFVTTVPVLHEKNKVCEAMIDARDALRDSKDITINESKRIDALNDAITIARNNSGRSNIKETMNLREALLYLEALDNIVSIDEEYVLELSITNSLKLAMQNLKRGLVKLSDKEKKLSGTIDMHMNDVSKGIEQAMMMDNREAVIKGKLIPSASKCIKLALGLGVAWIINPAIAVIGAIGTFACMKKMQDKERQLILDDIDIELKMCERYINQYEAKGDLKKVREVEKIQRNLQRQNQRIKYKMNVFSNSKVPTSPTATPSSRNGDD